MLSLRTTQHLGREQFALGLSVPATTALGGLLFQSGGFVIVLCMGVGFYFLAWSFAIWRLWNFEEELANKRVNNKMSLTELVHPSHIFDTVKVIFKPRTNFKRFFLLVLFFVFLSDEFHDQGEVVHEFLFTKRFFSWRVSDFSWFKTVDSLSTSVGTVVLLPLLHYFKATDNIIILITLVSLISSNMIRGLSTVYSTFYFSIMVDFPNGMLAAPVRGQMSRCVDPSELGKALSMLDSLQSLMPVLATNTYTRVYTSTRNLDYPLPGSCYFVSCFALALAAAAIIVMSFRLKCGHVPLEQGGRD